MVGFAHVALHLALCGSAARASAQTPVALQVRVTDRIGRPQVNQTYSVQRGYGGESVVEFDVPGGVYRLQVSAPKYHCSASDFLVFMADHNRTISEQLTQGMHAEFLPLLLNGTTPAAFFYAHPDFVAFDKSTACNHPAADPVPLQADVENDQDAYYARLYLNAASVPHNPVLVAVRLRTAAAQYHYVRLPMRFPVAWSGWPMDFQLNIPEDYLDSLATEPVDTLLCPKFTVTSVY
jgi:hypothetical protein